MTNCGQSFNIWKTITSFWPKDVGKKTRSLSGKIILMDGDKKAKTKITEKYLFNVQNKKIMNRPATLYKI